MRGRKPHRVSKEEELTKERIRALMLNWDRMRRKSKQFKSIKLSKRGYKKYLASIPTEDVADVVDKAQELYFNQGDMASRNIPATGSSPIIVRQMSSTSRSICSTS